MRGYGKIILFGEHSVVYGYPALAAATHLGIKSQVKQESDTFCLEVPTWNLKIESGTETPIQEALLFVENKLAKEKYTISALPEIPSGAGLGSSAALSVSLIRTILDFQKESMENAEINELALEMEKIFHGTPSGIDNTVATYGGLCYVYDPKNFTCPLPKHPEEIPLGEKRGARIKSLGKKISFVIVDTKKERTTKELVAKVRSLYNQNPEQTKKVMDELGSFATSGYQMLINEEHNKFGTTMCQAHRLLRQLQVSCSELDTVYDIAMQNGALGAKLTGAGGGGCMIVFAPTEETNMQKTFQQKGWSSFIADIEI